MQYQLYAKFCGPFHRGSPSSWREMELGTGWEVLLLGGTGQHVGVGSGCSIHSARVFEQGVGIRPAREGEGGGPAELVQQVPGPCQSHPCGLGTTPSHRPTGAKVPVRRV